MEEKSVLNPDETSELTSSNDILIAKTFTSSNDILIAKTLTSSNDILVEIQKKADQISDQTKGTQIEKLGNELSLSGQLFLEVTDPVSFTKNFEYFVNNLSNISSKLPESQESHKLLKRIKEEQLIENKIPLMNDLLSEILYQLGKINSEKEKSGFFDSFATRASFLGFIVLELLNLWRPFGSTNHIICLLVIAIFFIFTIIIYIKKSLKNQDNIS